MGHAENPAAARAVATRVVRRLRDAGHVAYFAGGCVRDALLGMRPTDFDVATDAPPQKVRSLFPRTDAVGAAFGVVLVHEHEAGARITVEVATFRSDGAYSDARRPDTIHFSDPESDARRRDFTINALFLDPLDTGSTAPEAAEAGGRVIDYVGGLQDLRNKVIRAVGDPHTRLAEDHLRALRAVRFAARLGFTLDPATAEAIRIQAAGLRGVSRERIGEELRRMIPPLTRAAALALLQHLGLDAPVLDEPHRDIPLPLVSALGPEPVSTPAGLVAWMLDRYAPIDALSPKQAADAILRWRQALCLSNDETERLERIARGFSDVLHRWRAMRVSEKKRLVNSTCFGDIFRLVTARDSLLGEHVRAEVGTLEGDGIGVGPRPLVTGDDLIASGMKAGPAFRRILDEVYDAQLEGRVKNKAAAMELARTLGV